MRCPYCNSEMVIGDFKCSSALTAISSHPRPRPAIAYFSQKPHNPLFPRKGDVPIKGYVDYAKGNLCEKCNKIIVDYSTVHNYEK